MAGNIVHAVSFFRHPKTGRRVPDSQEAEFRAWFKRQKRFKGRRPKKERWLYLLDSEIAKPGKGVKIGEHWHRIQQQYKMTETEKILAPSKFTDRDIRQTFNNKEVFRRIWDNWGGIIRVSVSGHIADDQIGSRRVREVFHLGFHKEHWESMIAGTRSRPISGREMFRRWLISSVSSNLRRRGLRLSNPKESQQRVTRLRQDLMRLQAQTEYMGYMKPEKMGAHVQQILWKSQAIKKQQKTKQLQGATIRIEKLV